MQNIILLTRSGKGFKGVDIKQVRALAKTGGYRENIQVEELERTDSRNIGLATSRPLNTATPSQEDKTFHFCVDGDGKLDFC